MPNDHIASDEVGRKRVLNDKNDDSRVFNYRSYNQNDGCSSNTVVKMECIVDEESGSSCKLQGIQEELLGRTNNDVVQVEEERPEDIKKIQKEY